MRIEQSEMALSEPEKFDFKEVFQDFKEQDELNKLSQLLIQSCRNNSKQSYLSPLCPTLTNQISNKHKKISSSKQLQGLAGVSVAQIRSRSKDKNDYLFKFTG